MSLNNGNFSIIIPKNTSLPCSITKKYETAYDNQTGVSFNFYQGERYMVKYNNYLNDFNINGLREAHKGKVKFYVTMELDKNGILKINVNEINGNHSKSMLIKGVNDLSSEQIKWFKEQELISKMMTNYINKK